jgi:hypothetical protein
MFIEPLPSSGSIRHSIDVSRDSVQFFQGCEKIAYFDKQRPQPVNGYHGESFDNLSRDDLRDSAAVP